MNIFENLKNLLNSESFSRKDFEQFKIENLKDGKINHLELAFILKELQSEFQKKKMLDRSDIESNEIMIKFIQDNSPKLKQKRKKQFKKQRIKKKKRTLYAKTGSTKKSKRLSKTEKSALNRLKGNVEKTREQKEAEEKNEARKKQLKSLPTTTRNSIWTVK